MFLLVLLRLNLRSNFLTIILRLAFILYIKCYVANKMEAALIYGHLLSIVLRSSFQISFKLADSELVNNCTQFMKPLFEI